VALVAALATVGVSDADAQATMVRRGRLARPEDEAPVAVEVA